jgi:hypothetical protein
MNVQEIATGLEFEYKVRLVLVVEKLLQIDACKPYFYF